MFYAAMLTRAADFVRAGLPPGGSLGPGSSADSASSTSSIVTMWRDPGSSLSAGFDITAAASDAQDARIARFSPVDIVWSAKTSRGWS
jgi:hypothetical protein